MTLARHTGASTLRIAAVLAIGLTACAALTGCVEPTDVATPAPSSSSTPSPTAPASDAPTTDPTPGAEAPTPIDASCETLVPLQALYDVDPNLALLTDSAPTSPLAVEAVGADGVACTLVHTSNGATIELAVSSPGANALAAARAGAGEPLDLGIAGVDGFSSAAGVQAFSGTTRFSAESAAYGADLLSILIAIPIAAGR